MSHMINRRSFLKVTVGAAAMPRWVPTATAAAPKRDLRKAIMYSTIGVKGSVLEQFRAMKEAGFEGVEPMGGMNRDEVIAAFKETGLQAASVCCHTHWEKPLSAPDEATRKIGLDGLLTSLHDAKAYGAGSVLLVPGVARNGVTYQQCFDRSIVEIRKAIPVAQGDRREDLHRERRQQFHREAGAGGGIPRRDQQRVGRLAFRHRQRRPHRPGRAVDQRDRPTHQPHPRQGLQRQTHGGGGDGHHTPKLLDGDTNWPAVMKALDDAGYSGWGISEQPPNQAADVETARDLAQRMDRIFAL